ncbi:hypothetical protein HYPSUDRAFT_89487 [Hypholoma sublateritium FD-334 SS-4]|uniref:Rho-GAP domain-containing protein n=1 Tax=Hypholoma sublateritium (strain FD-334 SS-4) TaxID=945553 RepID=A0A0D2NJW4_HYPSF|nr:hypothetical protein HYPSUDRAFT_89487 [Hypholoma sublateritium FD-334 SS-4]
MSRGGAFFLSFFSFFNYLRFSINTTDNMSLKPSANPLSGDPSPRNPRIHRQTGIPSISRPRTHTTSGIPESSQAKDGATGIGKATAFGSLKKTAYHLLNKTSDVSDSALPRPRISSMPSQKQIPLLDTQVAMDTSHTQRTSVASPPVIDFTNFEDNYREPRAGDFDGTMKSRTTRKVISGRNGAIESACKGSPIFVNDKVPVSGTPLPASSRKPDPRLILSSLESILGVETSIAKYLNAHELLAMHQLDQVDFDDRDRMRAKLIKHDILDIPGRKNFLTVLGEPIRKASIYSSTPMVLAGREHELPIIVVNTVEELYRTGIYQPNLFRTLPNRTRLLELIDIYDSEDQPAKGVIHFRHSSSYGHVPNAGFGSNTTLDLESTPDVCALLTTYLSSLSEPILTPIFFHPIWYWCGLDSEDTETMQRQDSFGPRLSHIPLARTYTSPTESTHILVAQLILQLLPSPNFSLLVYLLAFFSQAALVREENGVGVSDLSRMFGGRLFGGEASRDISEGSNITQRRKDGETMMNWFLRRWGPISDGLFEVVEDAKMGLFHRPLARRDSFGKDILPSWLPGVGGNLDPKRCSLSSDSHIANSVHDLSRSSSFILEKPCDDDVHPQIQSDDIPLQSTPTSRFKHQSSLPSLPDSRHRESGVWAPTTDAVPDETLDITQLPLREDHISILSNAALDERLLDISMPTLLDQTLSAAQVPSKDALRQGGPSGYQNRGTQTVPATPLDLIHALQLTAHLEAQLEERTDSLTEALADLTKSKFIASKLHRRVYELEAELDTRRASRPLETAPLSTDHASEARLETNMKDLSDARDIVREIQKLVKN